MATTRTDPAEPSDSDSPSVSQPFPLGEVLGLRLEEPASGIANGGFEVAPVHLNPNGVVHGAALSALVDTLMGLACISLLPAGSQCSTVDLHIRYLRPVAAGVVTGRVEVVHQGRRLVSLAGEVHGVEGLVASATATFAVNHASGEVMG